MNPTVLALVLCAAVLASGDSRPTRAPQTVELPAGRFQLNHEKTLISQLGQGRVRRRGGRAPARRPDLDAR